MMDIQYKKALFGLPQYDDIVKKTKNNYLATNIIVDKFMRTKSNILSSGEGILEIRCDFFE